MKVELKAGIRKNREFPFLAYNKNYSGDSSIFLIIGFNEDYPNVYEGFCICSGDEKLPQFNLGDFSNNLSSTNLVPFNGSVTLSND